MVHKAEILHKNSFAFGAFWDLWKLYNPTDTTTGVNYECSKCHVNSTHFATFCLHLQRFHKLPMIFKCKQCQKAAVQNKIDEAEFKGMAILVMEFQVRSYKIRWIFKGRIFSEKYWYYFHCPKIVLCSILSFVFWIFPPLDTAVQLESADSKQNTISKSLFQDSFRHIFWAMRKMHHTFWKKATFSVNC